MTAQTLVGIITATLVRPPLHPLYAALAIFAFIILLSPAPTFIDDSDTNDYSDDSTLPVPAPAEDASPAVATISISNQFPRNTTFSVSIADAIAPPKPVWLEYRIRRGDTMDKVLRAIRVDDELRSYLVRQKFKTYRQLHPKKIVYFQQNDDGSMREMLYKTSPDYYFTAGRDDSGALWAKEEAPQTSAVREERGGAIDSTLYEATAAAGMSDIASDKLVQVLETQIDFYRDVRKGDSFRVIYDSKRDAQGDLIDAGNIVAFEYNSTHESRPRLIRGVHYQKDDHSGYFDPEGNSLQRAFLPAPLKYRRISSRFSKNRYHPVLKRWRPHRGVDYAARSGTPVHATADGVVSLIDHQRGYGKVIMLKHYNNVYTTVYAHLRAFKKGMRRGRHVKQGDVIGFVGSTGLSTGPHLHYEFRVHGKHRDPLSTNIPKKLPSLNGDALAQFKRHSDPLFSRLDAISTGAAEETTATETTAAIAQQ